VGRIKRVESVIAFCAVISRHDQGLSWSIEQLRKIWGCETEYPLEVPFDAAEYYRAEMGEGVRKWMVAAVEVQDPGKLAQWKVRTGLLEEEFAGREVFTEPRPLNLDPGYISQAKLVLATVKDRDHRIYLCEGIFAEVTLRYLRSGWTDNPWTYRDYQRAELKQFADHCRGRLRNHLIAEGGFRS
jgi:hypothetical protein